MVSSEHNPVLTSLLAALAREVRVLENVVRTASVCPPNVRRTDLAS